jgi:hypothetical protein
MGHMIPVWLNLTGISSIRIAFACAAVLWVDVVRRPQPMAIMNVVWPIMALYFGPVSVLCLVDREFAITQ